MIVYILSNSSPFLIVFEAIRRTELPMLHRIVLGSQLLHKRQTLLDI
jgi:hypothetical protein